MRKTKLPLQLIIDLLREGKIAQLIFLLRIRSLTRNGTIYYNGMQDLAGRMGMSRQTCSKHIRFLMDRGIIRKHNGNYTLVSAYKLAKKYTGKNQTQRVITISVSPNRSEQLDIVRAEVLRSGLDQQNYRKREKEEYKRLQEKEQSGANMTREEVKRFLALRKKIGSNPETPFQAGYSNGQIGLLFNRSASTGKRAKVRLRKSGRIRTRRQFERLFQTTEEGFRHFRANYEGSDRGSFFFKEGWVLKETGNSIEMLEGIPVMQ